MLFVFSEIWSLHILCCNCNCHLKTVSLNAVKRVSFSRWWWYWLFDLMTTIVVLLFFFLNIGWIAYRKKWVYWVLLGWTSISLFLNSFSSILIPSMNILFSSCLRFSRNPLSERAYSSAEKVSLTYISSLNLHFFMREEEEEEEAVEDSLLRLAVVDGITESSCTAFQFWRRCSMMRLSGESLL